MRYGWFYLMICWRTDTKIMSPTTICLLIMYNKWIPCCCASPQKYITDDVKMGYEHQWHTRLRLVSFFCIHIWRHLWSITEHTHENMESVSVNWKSDFSVTQKLDSNLPFFAALTFGVIVIGGAFVVKYVGTMVLQVCFCITVSSIADFFLIAGTMQGSLFDNCNHCLLLADFLIFRSVAEVSDLAICSLTQHRSRVSCENLYVNFNLCSTVLVISI